MKKLYIITALTALVFSLSACHTVAGAGQDVSETGQTVTKAANATAQKM